MRLRRRSGLFSASLPRFILLLFSLSLLPLAGCGDDGDAATDDPESAAASADEGDEEGTSTDDPTDTTDGADDSGDEEGSATTEVEPGRYRFSLKTASGESYGYRLTRTQKVTAGEFTTTQVQRYDVTMEVIDRNDDGSLVFGVTYDRVRAEMTAPQLVPDSTGKAPLLDSTGAPVMKKQTVRFDTKGNAGKMLGGDRFRAFIGRKVLVTTDRIGQVIDVANVDPIFNAMLKRMKVSADTLSPKLVEATKSGIRLEVGMMVSQIFFTLLPDSAVSTGSDWSMQDSVALAGLPAVSTIKYTLSEIGGPEEEPIATIKGRLKTTPRLPKKEIEANGMAMKIEKLTVSGNGTTKLSVRTGFPLSRNSTITSRMSGTGSIRQGPRTGESAPMTYVESTTNRIERTAYRKRGE